MAWFRRLPIISWRIVERLLFLFADDRLTLARRTRFLIHGLLIFSTVVFACGIAQWKSAYVNSAGIVLDICGALRLFLKEEWDDILQYYADTNAYPYGPPSYIMREYFADDTSPALIEDEKARLSGHYYANRGVLMLVLGFSLQLLSNLMI